MPGSAGIKYLHSGIRGFRGACVQGLVVVVLGLVRGSSVRGSGFPSRCIAGYAAFLSSSLSLSSLELSDTKVYDPGIRARLGTTVA